MIKALGYIVLGVSDIAAWRDYAGNVLGTDVADGPAGSLKLRVDSRDWRIAIEPSGENDIVAAGWEVDGAVALETVIASLEAAGTAVKRDDCSLAAKRGVMGIASFNDPSGTGGEIFWGATDRSERPFVSPAGVRGFVTDPVGLGHIVISANDMGEMARFYGDVLGFKYSDRIDMPVGPDMRVPVDFWHCNPRHHTLAFAPARPDELTKLIHFLLQVDNFDDVGHAIDRCEKHGIGFATTLGRHSNDHMLSFYHYSPSGFEVEFGFGAREIDDASWTPVRHDTTSSWGHKFIGQGAQRG